MRRRSKLEGLGRNNKSSINWKLKLSVFSANTEDNTTRQTSFILSFKTRFSRKRDFFRKKERKKEKMIPRYVSIVENPRLSSIYSTFESSLLDRSIPIIDRRSLIEHLGRRMSPRANLHSNVAANYNPPPPRIDDRDVIFGEGYRDRC